MNLSFAEFSKVNEVALPSAEGNITVNKTNFSNYKKDKITQGIN
jgi:hypothetical protein